VHAGSVNTNGAITKKMPQQHAKAAYLYQRTMVFSAVLDTMNTRQWGFVVWPAIIGRKTFEEIEKREWRFVQYGVLYSTAVSHRL
jgi:hypothetical protein